MTDQENAETTMIRPTMETVKIWIALNLAQRSVYREIEATLKAENLPSLRWYNILWALQHNEEGLRATEIEKSLLFEQSNLSRLLRQMINDGLVEERPCTKDRRAKSLYLTNLGKKTHDKMWLVYGNQIHKLMGNIPKEFDAVQITQALDSLVESEITKRFV